MFGNLDTASDLKKELNHIVSDYESPNKSFQKFISLIL